MLFGTTVESGRAALAARLHELRLRAAALLAAFAAGAVGLAFLGLAAYRGLARVMAPDLAAATLGAVSLALALLALAWSRRRARPARVEASRAAGDDPAAAVGASLASLLRRAEAGRSDLATAGLVAGFVLGARRRERE